MCMHSRMSCLRSGSGTAACCVGQPQFCCRVRFSRFVARTIGFLLSCMARSQMDRSAARSNRVEFGNRDSNSRLSYGSASAASAWSEDCAGGAAESRREKESTRGEQRRRTPGTVVRKPGSAVFDGLEVLPVHISKRISAQRACIPRVVVSSKYTWVVWSVYSVNCSSEDSRQVRCGSERTPAKPVIPFCSVPYLRSVSLRTRPSNAQVCSIPHQGLRLWHNSSASAMTSERQFGRQRYRVCPEMEVLTAANAI
jgi:hypothetical protein